MSCPKQMGSLFKLVGGGGGAQRVEGVKVHTIKFLMDTILSLYLIDFLANIWNRVLPKKVKLHHLRSLA